MNEKITTLFELPYSTGDCDFGPKIEYVPGAVKLSYDYEGEEIVSWCVLQFDAALAIRLTPDVSVTEQMVGAYSKVCEYENSVWTKELVHEAQKHDAELPKYLKHMLVYFDHYGCVEVLARDVRIVVPAKKK